MKGRLEMKKVYGFAAANDGLLEVIPNQAAVVQEIYRQYLSGKSLGGIADFLFEQNIPSPSGKERWSKSVLDKLLSNRRRGTEGPAANSRGLSL